MEAKTLFYSSFHPENTRIMHIWPEINHAGHLYLVQIFHRPYDVPLDIEVTVDDARTLTENMRVNVAKPTFAVIAALERVFKDYNKAEAVIGYDIRIPGSGGKAPSLKYAVNDAAVQEYLKMHLPAKYVPLKNYTVFWGIAAHHDMTLHWMTLQARTASEAFLISQRSSAELGIQANDYLSFAIYEGWHKPVVLDGRANLVRLPSVWTDPEQEPPRPTRHGTTDDVTEIRIDDFNVEPEETYTLEDSTDTTVAVLTGKPREVSREVNDDLLTYFLGKFALQGPETSGAYYKAGYGEFKPAPERIRVRNSSWASDDFS